MTLADGPRRPLKSRSAGWAQWLAKQLSKSSITPNAISVASVLFAAGGGILMLVHGWAKVEGSWGLLVGAAVYAQLRLLCNLMDGLVAVEGGKATPGGEFFNDLPDRLADLFLLVPVGLIAGPWPYAYELGWLAGTLAVLTAYVRVLAGSMGLTQDFVGPMAKPHRMFVLTLGLLLAVLEIRLGLPPRVLYFSLCLIILGSLVVVVRRSFRLLAEARKTP